MILGEVYTHYHLPTSHIFDGDFATATPDKSKLVAHCKTVSVFTLQ